MEPITLIIILLLVIIIGGWISHLQRSKKLAKDPTYQRIEMLEKDDYPEVVQDYNLENLDNLRSCWLENGIEFSDLNFQELCNMSIEAEDCSPSKKSIDLNLEFHGHKEPVYILIECYHKLGNIMHIYSKNQPLLDAFTKAGNQAKKSE